MIIKELSYKYNISEEHIHSMLDKVVDMGIDGNQQVKMVEQMVKLRSSIKDKLKGRERIKHKKQC
jgi:predicted DNA-binding protein YlxM (UPF0122 family)